ncbi:precorrin-3B synthase [Paracoccus yeei]|uniref:precorrin-3B synthase n=2 Tax=Paracoccus yeei TaxID=147645 RepID=UPI003BF91A75
MTIKGWCPGALRPMTSGDGLILRVRPPLSRLAPVQARGLAALAQGCGAGVLHLTNRANLQIRGVGPADLPALHAGLARLGLLDPSPEAEARRNLILCPFHDAAEQTVAARLGEALRAADGLALPAKFGFAVGASVAADIRILSLGGVMALAPQGAALGLPVATDRAVPAAMAMARWFIASGGVGPDGRGRMAAHLAGGAVLPPELAGTVPMPPLPPPPGPSQRLAGFVFGEVPADLLGGLADLGPLRLTPWRMIALPEPLPATLVRHPALIARPDDPRLRVAACAGAPACPQAGGPTRPLARALAAGVPRGAMLHVSGCAKGCAHPGPAAVTLVAVPGGFALIRDGTARDAPERLLSDPETFPLFKDFHAPEL